MKRFISTLCLLVGASVASYAGIITGGLVGSNVYTQDFDGITLGQTFPLNSLPFTSSGGNSTITVSITSSAPGSIPGATGTSSFNTGAGPGFVTSNAANGRGITNFDGIDLFQANSYARFMTLTFSAPVSEFLVDYFGNAGGHFIWVNGVATAIGNTANGSIGAQVGSAGTGTIANSFSSVTFQFLGNDSGNNGDFLIFDNLRITDSNGTIEPPPQTTGGNNGGGEVPEPSTYALMGAGLLALVYSRRKK